MSRVLCVRFSSIGDVLLTTPLVRALKRRYPDVALSFVTKRAMAPLLSDNPHIARVVTLEPGQSVLDLAQHLRDLRPTHGLDLHGSLRSATLRLLVRCRWAGYAKRKPARAVLIATKLDLYGRHTPVAERYFEAARGAGLDVAPDGGPPEFFLNDAARARVARWLGEQGLG
ncbi:MAG: glycosyltransferase family 9 protein, partial [Gemmatimonadales bacterium]